MESTFFKIVNNIIINAAVFDNEQTAIEMGYKPYVEGKWIGDRYDDTPTNGELSEENKLLKAQVTATNAYMDFLEECLVEMAGIVYV